MSFDFANAMTPVKNPVEVVDNARIKIVKLDVDGYGLYMARTLIPYPRVLQIFEYKNLSEFNVSSKSALEFCRSNRTR